MHVGKLGAWVIFLALAGCQSHAASGAAVAMMPPSDQVVAPVANAKATPPEEAEDMRRARQLAQRILIIDGHIDLPMRLHTFFRSPGEAAPDVRQRTKDGDFDLVRAKEGGLDAPFMSIFVPPRLQKSGGAKVFADELIDLVEGLIAASPKRLARAHSVAELQEAFRGGRIALPLGIENGAALEGSLDNLRHFYRRGVRYITLAHAKDNAICDSSYATTHTHGGLSAFGKQVVAEMNRLGVMVDVSHISDASFDDVIALSKAPVIASHSSCRHFTPGFERNMSDDMIKRLAKAGGVIMINFGSTFVTEASQRYGGILSKARKAFMTEHQLVWTDPKVKAWTEAYRAASPLPFAKVEDVTDHIEHVIALVGIEHVGLGSDFDGVGDSLPEGLKDASELPNLLRVLLKRGHSESALEKLCGRNLLRVWGAVERHAQQASQKAP